MSDQSSSQPNKRKYTRHYHDDDSPILNIGMAALFFDLTAASFLVKEKNGYFIDRNGDPIPIRRTPKGTRIFSLNDILVIAHALRYQNKMTSRQLRVITLRVDAFKEPVKRYSKKFRKGTIHGEKLPPPRT